jgi:hypothetical protein
MEPKAPGSAGEQPKKPRTLYHHTWVTNVPLMANS